MDVDVKSSQVDFDFVGDIEMYQDRVAVATGIPKGYLVQEWGGFGNSAISLTEQFKPFARAVYGLQSAFLDGLADLFRLHFAISGDVDFKIPFTLSMRFPAEEISDEKMGTRSASLELAAAVLDTVRAAIGAEEDEGLPPDIVKDILGKFTFLDPVDIVKWTRDAQYSRAAQDLDSLGGGDGGGFGEDEDFDLEDDMNDEDLDVGSDNDFEASEEFDFGDAVEEAKDSDKQRLKELSAKRFRELSSRYREAKEGIYFRILKENAMGDFLRDRRHYHVSLSESPALDFTLQHLTNSYEGGLRKLNESAKTYTDLLNETRESNDLRESYQDDPDEDSKEE